MHKVFNLTIVDMEKEIFSGQVEQIIAPSLNGEIAIYANHTALISKLKPGILRLTTPSVAKQIIYAISGGFLEVQTNQALILADLVKRTINLDMDKLEKQKALAINKLKHNETKLVTPGAAKLSLEIAIAQLKAIEYINKHK